MKNTCLLALSLLVSIALRSQNDPQAQALLYRLSDKEASAFFLQNKLEPQPRHFHDLLDSNRAGGHWNLPGGHFLSVSEEQGEVSVSLLSSNSISIQALQNRREFAFRVLDSLGAPLPDAGVSAGSRPIRFDQKTQAFVLKAHDFNRGNGRGKVRFVVRASGEVAFFEVEEEHDYYRSQQGRFFKKAARNITHPLKWGRRLYSRTAHWADRKFRQLTEGEGNYKGYMALNKPKFLPGDTVKIKGYFTKKNGKPLRQTLQLRLQTSPRFQSWDVVPTEPGVYIAEIPLHDSLNLKLDWVYQLTFYRQRKRNDHRVFSHNFRYEDYQLDEVTYSLTSNQKEYVPGDSILLSTDGKFSNGLRIPDGTLRLVVHSDATRQSFQPTDFFEKEIRLPDTLWTHEQAFDADSPTLLLLPDSIFPKVKIQVFVSAQFSNSNGELQTKSLSFWRKPRPNCLSLTLDGAWLVGQCELGDNLQRKAWLEVTGNDFQFQKEVSLPFRERVNGSATHYVLRFSPRPMPGEMPAQLGLQPEPSQVSASGGHTGDSLVFQIEKPRQLHVLFDLFKDKTLVERGSTEAETFRFARPASRGDDFRLQLRYVWAGSLREESEDFLFFKKKLDIVLEQPETIEPGATVQVRVQVKNARQRAARNVNLVAGAVNAQFGQLNNFKGPELTRKLPKFPRRFPEIEAEPSKLPDARLPLTKAWATKLQLDTQFLFIERGVLLRYDTVTRDSFYKNIAQFAPYLVAEGKQQAILMIYCNRQLAWFYGASDRQPYSFIGRPGWNQIKLRTRHFEYELDSVWLKKGYKLELAIHPTEYPNLSISEYPNLHIRKTKMPEQLTPFEKNLVRQSFFVLRARGEGIHAVSQGDGNIHVFQSERVFGTQLIRLGPFRRDLPMRYVLRDSLDRTFKFEPGFSYSISPNRERLYEYKWFEHPDGSYREESLPHPQSPTPNPQSPGDVVFSPSDVIERSPVREWQELKFSAAPNKTMSGNGVFQFYFYKNRPPLIAILLEKTGAETLVFQSFRRNFHDLSPGKYRFVLVGADSSFLEHEFEAIPNTLIFNDLNELSFQRDSAAYWLGVLRDHSLPRKERLSTPLGNIPHTNPAVGDMIYGIVTDASGEALIGVSVFVRGTSVGTVTDVDGSYSLAVQPGAQTLVFSYTGFLEEAVAIGSSGEVSLVMRESSEQLSEVVVIGYSTQKRSSAVSSYSLKEVAGNRPNEFMSKKFADAGLPIAIGIASDLPPDIRLRKNFRDEGYWQPQLSTDANGEAFFTVTFPENTTQWRSYVLGMDKRQRAGAGFANTNAFRQLMAQLALPRFLVEGDRAEVVGKALNYTGDTLEVATVFSMGDAVLKTGSASIGNALIEKTAVVAPFGTDSLTLRYSLKTVASPSGGAVPSPSGGGMHTTPPPSGDGMHTIPPPEGDGTAPPEGDATARYGDGEERSLPIFPKGTDESEGSFFLLENDTSLTLTFDPAKGPVTLRAESDALKILSGSLDYLIEYPYGCNEQVSGRLLALLLAKQLKTAMGEPFGQEDYLKKAIAMLSKTQDEQGFWGWCNTDPMRPSGPGGCRTAPPWRRRARCRRRCSGTAAPMPARPHAPWPASARALART